MKFKNNLALLILRMGIGFMFLIHGYPKIIGGLDKWIGLGLYGMGSIGISIFPAFWGFMAAFAEFIGGLMIIFGFYTRFFSFLLLITMFIASVAHLIGGDGILGASHAIELALVFLFICIIGPGEFTLRNILFKKK